MNRQGSAGLSVIAAAAFVILLVPLAVRLIVFASDFVLTARLDKFIELTLIDAENMEIEVVAEEDILQLKTAENTAYALQDALFINLINNRLYSCSPNVEIKYEEYNSETGQKFELPKPCVTVVNFGSLPSRWLTTANRKILPSSLSSVQKED